MFPSLTDDIILITGIVFSGTLHGTVMRELEWKKANNILILLLKYFDSTTFPKGLGASRGFWTTVRTAALVK